MKHNYYENVLKKTLVFLFMIVSVSFYAQDAIIKGNVTSSIGELLPGASVVQKGSSNGVVTDFDGNYQIVLEANGEKTLIFSFIGFIDKELNIDGRTTIDVSLQEDVAGLDEVVVVGYGTARRKDITGSVSTLKLEDSPVALRATTNVLQSLQGTVAGLNIGTQNRPGETPSITVRGQNSINGSNNPLIVLDGVVFLGSMSDINPDDIATLDVLKDASAAAVYGSRAANGVIMVTTKKGKSDKPLIQFTTSVGINNWQSPPEMTNLEQWTTKYVAQTPAFNSAADVTFDSAIPTSLFNQGIDTDWVDLVSRNGIMQNHQISVSGRTDKMNYYFSGGYQEQEGVIVGDDYNRISVRAKLDTDITDWLKVGVDATYNRNDYSGIGANLRFAYLLSPFAYPYRYEGMPNNAAANTSRLLERYPTGESIPNPLWDTNDEFVDDVDLRNFFRGTAYALIKIPQIKGLSYRFNYSVNANFNNREQFFHEGYYVGVQAGDPYDRYSESNLSTLLGQANGYVLRNNSYQYVMDNIINYKKQFGDHYIDFTAVATRDESYRDPVLSSGSDFSTIGNTFLGVNGLSNANVQSTTTLVGASDPDDDFGIVRRSNVGYLGRLSYTYKDTYHLNGTIRRDGASVFGAEQLWGDFSSVGVAWTLSNEDFMTNLSDKINYFKLKASYGTNGNQGLDPYETLSVVQAGTNGGIRYEFGDNPSEVLYGIAQTTLGNPNLGWESTTAFNIGFQSALFNNKVFLDVDYYRSQTRDQIFRRNIPIANGFESILASLGQVDNAGLELSLTTVIKDTEDFKWSSTLNFWQNRNKIVELYGDDADGDGVEDDDIANSYFIGKPLGAIYGYEYDGVVQESDTEYIANTGANPGDAKYVDLNGDGLIDVDNDRKILGYSTPNFRMGLSNTFQYKNWSLYVLATGIFGGGKDNYYLASNPRSNSFTNDRFDRSEINIPFWTPENASETYHSATFVDDRYLGLQSRGFVKIQDINLSYKLPQKVLQNIGFSSMELYTAVNNAFTFTNWFGGGDPEDGNNGINAGSVTYPVPSVYTMGLKVSF